MPTNNDRFNFKRMTNPDELVEVVDVIGVSRLVKRRSLLRVGLKHTGPFLHCFKEDGEEIVGQLLHFANIRKEPLSEERKALEALFPMVDHLTMCASAEGNGDCVTVNYDYANQMLLLIIRGLRAGDEAQAEEPAEELTQFIAERLGEGEKV